MKYLRLVKSSMLVIFTCLLYITRVYLFRYIKDIHKQRRKLCNIWKREIKINLEEFLRIEIDGLAKYMSIELKLSGLQSHFVRHESCSHKVSFLEILWKVKQTICGYIFLISYLPFNLSVHYGMNNVHACPFNFMSLDMKKAEICNSPLKL